MSQENYKPEPLEFFHGKILDGFHEWRQTQEHDHTVKITGSDLNKIIASAKTQTYKEYPHMKKNENVEAIILKHTNQTIKPEAYMPTFRDKIIEIGLQEIGQTEQPAGSNKTKYGKWFGLDGQPWCGMFVSYLYHHAGKPLGNIGYLKGFAGCQTAVKYFREKGMITDKPEPGDIVFFDWNGDQRHEHCGIFVRHLDAQRFETIEGNTSIANQSNGGQVMKRVRSYNMGIFVKVK